MAVLEGHVIDGVYIHQTRDLSSLRGWYRYCWATGKPYVFVRPGWRLALVQMDLAAQGYVLSPEAAAHVIGLLHEHHAGPRDALVPTIPPPGNVLAFASARVPRTRAVDVAKQLFATAADPANQIPAGPPGSLKADT